VAIEPIRVTGLKEFSRDLKKIHADLPKALRVALNGTAGIVVDEARPRVPRLSGKAAASLKARSTRAAVRVTGGGNRCPWYPWLDFGGAVGRNRSVRRAFLSDGRYLYAAYHDRQPEFADVLEQALLDVVASAGIAVD
jgi:hypothetical protein